MLTAAPDVSAGEVLKAFHHDAPYFFLGGAFVAVGVLSAAFAALRRRRDPLLIYFAVFAAFYGVRLWIQSNLLRMSEHGSMFYTRLLSGIDYIVLIPAFLFFTALRLPGRIDRIVGYAVVGIGALLSVATFLFGNFRFYDRTNSVAVIAASSFFLIRFMFGCSAERNYSDAADLRVIRWGLLIFVAFVVWANVAALLRISSLKLEPFGFAAFLGTLGYVAARRALQRDQQLSEIQKELEVARRIQLSILPTEFPPSAHFRVAARYSPMTSVAGDFYDYILAGDHQAGFLIADVSGHGVPAALIASMVKLAAASQRAVAGDPARFLAGMNAALLGNTQNQFVTAAYVHLNAQSQELRYSAAGHPPLLLVRNGQVTRIEENGLMLAAFASASYSTASRTLEPGDRIVLYTDGILEASNAVGDFFGHDALCDVLMKTSDLPASQAADSIMSSIQHWSKTQDDDLTVLVCDYVPVRKRPEHRLAGNLETDKTFS